MNSSQRNKTIFVDIEKDPIMDQAMNIMATRLNWYDKVEKKLCLLLRIMRECVDDSMVKVIGKPTPVHLSIMEQYKSDKEYVEGILDNLPFYRIDSKQLERCNKLWKYYGYKERLRNEHT